MNNNRVCVVIPTYNNATTLASVVRGVAQHTPNIIVVKPRQGCGLAQRI